MGGGGGETTAAGRADPSTARVPHRACYAVRTSGTCSGPDAIVWPASALARCFVAAAPCRSGSRAASAATHGWAFQGKAIVRRVFEALHERHGLSRASVVYFTGPVLRTKSTEPFAMARDTRWFSYLIMYTVPYHNTTCYDELYYIMTCCYDSRVMAVCRPVAWAC